MPKHLPGPFWHLPVAVILLFLLFIFVLVTSSVGYFGEQYNYPAAETRRMTYGANTFDLRIATTPAEQAQGLSGVRKLGPGEGMLFVNQYVGERCIWMKDMQLPIDIIWLDDDKQVIRIEEYVSPNTYPQTFCARAQYVIELAAGEANRSGIGPGRTLRF